MQLPDVTGPQGFGVARDPQFRIKVDGKLTYSVPCQYASSQLTLKRFADRLLVYDRDELVAEHVRRYDRNQDYELCDYTDNGEPGGLLAGPTSAGPNS